MNSWDRVNSPTEYSGDNGLASLARPDEGVRACVVLEEGYSTPSVAFRTASTSAPKSFPSVPAFRYGLVESRW